MNDITHAGFIAPKEIAPKEWVFGGGNLPLVILQEDGDWGPILPIEETQNKGKFETYNCVSFGTTNVIELLMQKLTGERFNFSDRWVGIVAGTKAPGNDPNVVAEAIRKYGLIPEEMLPFSDDLQNIDEYYSFKGADKEACYKAGREWLAKYDFKHEWTFTPGQPVVEQLNNMKLALKGSPQGIAVFAWASTENDIYYKNGPENHWTTLYNVDDFMRVFDSYSPFKKNLEHALQYCKRYSIALRVEDPVKIGIMRQMIDALLKLVGLYKEQVVIVNQSKIDSQVIVKPAEVFKEVKEALKETMITKWAKAIAKWEGDVQGTNPGNLKYASLTASFGGRKGRPALDGGYFCVFDNYEQGFQALCKFLELGCKDQLRAFHKARTLGDFMRIYAGNPPSGYLKGVSIALGVPLNTQISTFL